MTSLEISFLFIIVAHFVGDFVLQTHRMAVNKSKSLFYLSYHVLVYTFCLQLFSALAFYYAWGIEGFYEEKLAKNLYMFVVWNGGSPSCSGLCNEPNQFQALRLW